MVVQRNFPTASPKKKPTTLQPLFEVDSKNKSISTLARHLSNAENEEILSSISYCTDMIFTFTDPLESPSQRDLKQVKLSEILSTIMSKKPLNKQILAPLMSVLSTNLFQPLPPPSNLCITPDLLDDEDPVSSFSPTWSHLQVVYDILLRLVISTDPEILREHGDHPFLLNLLSLFQSEDPSERDNLKDIYHRIYLKFTFYCSSMRESMKNVFLHYIFETERHCGVGELLEIWRTIINGFTVPLKEEHKLVLMRVLIPLHKTKGMQSFHRQLAYSVSQFVQKEPVLGGVVVRGLEELVAERALYVWNNGQFVMMASLAIEKVFPVVVEGVEKNLKWHWSKSILQLTENIKAMLEEMDPIFYSECLEEIDLRESRAHQEKIKRKERWETIEKAAAQNQNPCWQSTQKSLNIILED
ncbi:hypothetical protein I3843_06G114000 [Carya illinoinensis]|nr:hypothetical protein I3843_06G114000 [Carya illinoinensis]